MAKIFAVVRVLVDFGVCVILDVLIILFLKKTLKMDVCCCSCFKILFK